MPPAPTSRPISERPELGLPPLRCRSLQAPTCATPPRAPRFQGDHLTGKLPSSDSGELLQRGNYWSQAQCARAASKLAPNVLLHGCSERSKHGGRLLRLQSIQNRSRQPVLWVPPTTPDSAIERTPSGAEQRARTTAVAILAAVQNGTSARRSAESQAGLGPKMTRGHRQRRSL